MSKKTVVPELKIGELNIQMVPIESLVPSPNNSKIHTEAQVNDIIKSIKEFGFNDPLAIDENNVIIEGHGRRKALLKMGVKMVPVLRLSDMSEAQVKAYRIAHNKLTMKTGFDMDLLFSEMSELRELGFDVEMTGFTMDEMDGFSFDMPTHTETEPSNEPEMDIVDNTSTMKAQNKSIVQYILIFENDDQQQKWYKFLKHLREEYEGDTIAGRLDSFLSKNLEL